MATYIQHQEILPHGMLYFHFGNEVCNGAISITQQGFINDRYKVNPVGQWGIILVFGNGVCRSLGAQFGPSMMFSWRPTTGFQQK